MGNHCFISQFILVEIFYPDAKAKTTLHVLHKAAITRLDVERGNSGNFPRHFFSKTLRNV